MKIMQKKVEMLANDEDREGSQNPITNSVNESTNKKVATIVTSSTMAYRQLLLHQNLLALQLQHRTRK